MTNRTKIINANSLHTVESLRRWASCCFSQPVSRMLATVLEWLTDVLTGAIMESRKAARSKAVSSPPWISLKAHNHYPAYHIGPDFSNWKVPALWNSLHENVLLCGQCYRYWMSPICLAKMGQNCRIIGLNRAKKNKFYPRSVWLKKKKKQRLIVLFTSDVMKKSMFKMLV